MKQHPRGFLFHANVGTCVPLSDEDSPARAAFLELLLRDPEAARRERLEQRLAYWRTLVERRRANLEAAKQALAQAKTAVDRFDARAELEACQAELMAAEQGLAEAERRAR
ncbi:MAG: hypothetical protein WHT08_18100 [Bryobacteraceae bacterium]